MRETREHFIKKNEIEVEKFDGSRRRYEFNQNSNWLYIYDNISSPKPSRPIIKICASKNAAWNFIVQECKTDMQLAQGGKHVRGDEANL